MVSLYKFKKMIDLYVDLKKINTVAIISGGMGEPELELIGNKKNMTIDCLEYEVDPIKYDLHREWTGALYDDISSKYDLVLCEQVLEHVKDPYLAVANLSKILKPGGMLHISVPGVNNVHSDPHYFYAGFHYRALNSFVEKANLKVIESDGWCSDKGSRMYSTCDWSPISQSAGIPDVFNFLFKDFSIVRPYAFLRKIKHIMISEFKYPFQRLFGKDSEKDFINFFNQLKNNNFPKKKD